MLQIFIDGIQNGVLDWREASVEQEVNTDKVNDYLFN